MNSLPFIPARFILGNDFISPEEVARVYGFSYTEDQLAHFADTLPDFETLMWLRTNGYMLVAGPNEDLNLFGVRALDCLLFYPHDDYECWYIDEKQIFSRTDIVRGGQWLMLRKEGVPNSRSKRWSEQSKLVALPEYIPNVAEVSYGVTAYQKVRGVCLLKDHRFYTSSVNAYNNIVIIYRFCILYLGICDSWSNEHLADMEMPSARK